MIRRIPIHLAFLGIFILIFVSVISTVAAANIVPQTRLATRNEEVTANTLKPAQCAGLDLSNITTCTSKVCNGSTNNELILSSPDTSKVNGKGGTDCCVGAPGTDFSNCTWHN